MTDQPAPNSPGRSSPFTSLTLSTFVKASGEVEPSSADQRPSGIAAEGHQTLVLSNSSLEGGESMQLTAAHIAQAEAEETALKLLAQRNPRAAQDAIVRRYRAGIYQHAAYILKDQEEAIDVAQEVFIRAFREPRLYEADFRIKAWLYRVTTNLCFNMVRDRKRRSAILETVPMATTTHAGQSEHVHHEEKQRQIFEAMESISEEHRSILMLRYYDDLSYNEIADALQIKLGTVMSRLSRAKRRLMEALGAAGVQEDE